GGGGGADSSASSGDGASAAPGGSGGGIVFVRARAIPNAGTLGAAGDNSGVATTGGAEEGAGGAGAGGSVVVVGAGVFGTPAAAGGGLPPGGCNSVCGGNGGAGRTLTPEAVKVTGLKTAADPGVWSDGTLALSCIEYISCSTAGAGVYMVDPDGGDGEVPYLVQCSADGSMTRL
ncbi:MAG: hypothetical protein FJ086_15085, partial [Deltaproteobacteria bacterium]|nr:hypothetical protein [Deltaproteobacteria bacterium]